MMLASITSAVFDKLFFSDKWNIGYLNQSADDLIRQRKFSNKINWLEEDGVDYAADPFVISINGKPNIYYEELNFWKGNGELMKLDELHFSSKKKVRGVVPDNIHLSYPHIFKHNHKLYCIPETSAANEVALYSINEQSPEVLIKERALVQGKAFVDSSLAYYDNRYWLFCSTADAKDKLYIFYADGLAQEFKPHALNPITVADTSRRSAGRLFTVNGKLYMPTQNATKCYGGSVIINEIIVLTTTAYQYQPVFELLPQHPYEQGLHTVNFEGDLMIIDGKRRVFSLLTPIKKTVRKIRQSIK